MLVICKKSFHFDHTAKCMLKYAPHKMLASFKQGQYIITDLHMARFQGKLIFDQLIFRSHLVQKALSTGVGCIWRSPDRSCKTCAILADLFTIKITVRCQINNDHLLCTSSVRPQIQLSHYSLLRPYTIRILQFYSTVLSYQKREYGDTHLPPSANCLKIFETI